jgi:protein gp37
VSTTSIEWTDTVWNPTTGCDRISRGCDHCYALTLARRLKAMGSAKYQTDGDPRTSGPGFGITTHNEVLTAPRRWSTPRRVFVNSMSDLFHARVPDEFIAAVFAVMAMTRQHTYQVLTKRPTRMARLLSRPLFGHQVADQARPHLIGCQADWLAAGAMLGGRVLPNVWLGTSVEDQTHAEQRLPALLYTPAALRFVSCEPLLGPVDLTPWLACPHLSSSGDEGPAAALGREVRRWRCDWCATIHGQDAQGDLLPQQRGLGWVIAGGESGAGARPMHPDWARQLRDTTAAAGVPFFFKQRGAWTWEPTPGTEPAPTAYLHHDGGLVPEHAAPAPGEGWVGMWRVAGKAAAGRELDGATFNDMPQSTR